MKKSFQLFSSITVLALFILISTTQLQSQSRFGIRGGLNVSNVSFENLPNRSELFGYHVGIFADMPIINGFMYLQPELSFSTKGVNYEALGNEETLDMNYIEFLLPVAFRLGNIDIQVGPTAGYLVTSADYTVFEDLTVIEDAYNKFDAGLTAGLTYNFRNVMIGIRYNQGLVDVSTDRAEPFLGGGKNATGQISLGYKF